MLLKEIRGIENIEHVLHIEMITEKLMYLILNYDQIHQLFNYSFMYYKRWGTFQSTWYWTGHDQSITSWLLIMLSLQIRFSEARLSNSSLRNLQVKKWWTNWQMTSLKITKKWRMVGLGSSHGANILYYMYSYITKMSCEQYTSFIYNHFSVFALQLIELITLFHSCKNKVFVPQYNYS